MSKVDNLSDTLEKLQESIQRIKKEQMLQEKYLHNGELRIMKLISHYNNKFGNAPTLVNICNEVGISGATVTTLVDRLIKKELLIKENAQDDKRTKRLYLTEKGEEWLIVNKNNHNKFLSEVLESIDEEDVVELDRILKKINDYFNKKKEV